MGDLLYQDFHYGRKYSPSLAQVMLSAQQGYSKNYPQ